MHVRVIGLSEWRHTEVNASAANAKRLPWMAKRAYRLSVVSERKPNILKFESTTVPAKAESASFLNICGLIADCDAAGRSNALSRAQIFAFLRAVTIIVKLTVACVRLWPPVHGEAPPSVGEGVEACARVTLTEPCHALLCRGDIEYVKF